jgi:hypothetical protein
MFTSTRLLCKHSATAHARPSVVKGQVFRRKPEAAV